MSGTNIANGPPTSARIAKLAASLSRPVVRGMLPLSHARQAIVLAVYRSATPTPDMAGQIQVWDHILQLNINKAEARRDQAVSAIKKVLRPMLVSRKPSRYLAAAAHNANADHEFALTEQDVDDVISTEIEWAMRKAVSHGR